MRFCNECGQGNQDDAAFCVQCGAAVTGGPESGVGEPGRGGADEPSAGGGPEAEGAAPPPGPPVGPPPGPPAAPPVGPGFQPGAPPPPGVQAPFRPGPPPPQYVAPPPGYVPAPHQQTDGMAVASLIMGISGFFFCPLMGILAVIFGYMGKKNIAQSGGRLGGDSFCLAGIILGFIQIGLVVFLVVIWAIIAAVATSSGAVAPALVCLGLLAA